MCPNVSISFGSAGAWRFHTCQVRASWMEKELFSQNSLPISQKSKMILLLRLCHIWIWEGRFLVHLTKQSDGKDLRCLPGHRTLDFPCLKIPPGRLQYANSDFGDSWSPCERVTMGRISLGEQSAFLDRAWKNSKGVMGPRPQVTLSLECNNRLAS